MERTGDEARTKECASISQEGRKRPRARLREVWETKLDWKVSLSPIVRQLELPLPLPLPLLLLLLLRSEICLSRLCCLLRLLACLRDARASGSGGSPARCVNVLESCARAAHARPTVPFGENVAVPTRFALETVPVVLGGGRRAWQGVVCRVRRCAKPCSGCWRCAPAWCEIVAAGCRAHAGRDA